MTAAKIEAKLDDGKTKPLAVGRGSCALLRGSCRVDGPRLAELKLLADGIEAPVTRFAEPRDKGASDQRWWSVLDLPKISEPRVASLELNLRFGLRRRERASLGTIEIEPGWRAPRLELPAGQFDSDGSVTGALELRPLVAICVATSSPSVDTLERFIDWLTKQSYENWKCFIRDEGSSPKHLAALQEAAAKHERVEINGAVRGEWDRYSSVEAALMDAPAQAPYAALTMLDDSWSAPSTLERLLRSFASGVNAVVGIPGKESDLALGAADQVHDLASIRNRSKPGLIAWRRELTNYILPLPPAEQNGGDPEWWLLQVASALGRVQFRTISELKDEFVPRTSDGTLPKPTPETKLIAKILTDRILSLRCGGFLTHRARRRVAVIGQQATWPNG